VLRAGDELGRSGRMPPLRIRYVLPDGRVRHLEAATAAASSPRGARERTVGTLRDLTEQRVAEQELAARFAVSDLLANWQPGEPFLRCLLRDLGEPLDFEVGAMWVRRGDSRAVRARWLAPRLADAGLEEPMREARRPLKAGLIGAAWETGRPAAVVALPQNPDRADWLGVDLQGALALPATFGDGVLAVLSFASRDKVELTGRLLRSLTGVGHELGHFFARRRGELNAGPLTPRELEVLERVASGGSRGEIAEQLHVSESTIKTHLEHIYDKLGAHDRAGAVGAALRQGLIA
jgi:DNA-binding CsgD family transcriptional regulator